jgi:hypothetical protein
MARRLCDRRVLRRESVTVAPRQGVGSWQASNRDDIAFNDLFETSWDFSGTMKGTISSFAVSLLIHTIACMSAIFPPYFVTYEKKLNVIQFKNKIRFI